MQPEVKLPVDKYMQNSGTMFSLANGFDFTSKKINKRLCLRNSQSQLYHIMKYFAKDAF